MQRIIKLLLVIAVFAVAGCPFDLTSVKQTPAAMKIKAESRPKWILENKVDVPLESWSTTHLNPNTKWEYVGSIEQGDVYKTKDQVVTVVGSNMFEAYLVLLDSQIVGFYLPVEKGFTKISKPIKVNMNIIN